MPTDDLPAGVYYAIVRIDNVGYAGIVPYEVPLEITSVSPS